MLCVVQTILWLFFSHIRKELNRPGNGRRNNCPL
jgi:hypothetical protein